MTLEVIQPKQTVTENILMWVVGHSAVWTVFNCA